MWPVGQVDGQGLPHCGARCADSELILQNRSLFVYKKRLDQQKWPWTWYFIIYLLIKIEPGMFMEPRNRIRTWIRGPWTGRRRVVLENLGTGTSYLGRVILVERIIYLAPNSNLDLIICRRLKSGNCRIKIQSRFFEIAP